MEIMTTFKNIKQNQCFYTHRFANDKQDFDSIELWKDQQDYAVSREWPKSKMHPDQICWFYI